MSMLSRVRGKHKCNQLLQVPICEIVTNPHQPRKTFCKQSIEELAESIRRYGLLQPITIRQGQHTKYELIAGERRLRACLLLGQKTISAIVMEASNCDSAMLALVENLQRENLNFIDEAVGYNNLLMDFGMTQEELAKRLGKSQATVANKLRILRLSPLVQNMLKEHELTERHARALLRLSTEQEQLEVVHAICEQSLNVKQTEEYIDQLRLKQICNQPSEEKAEEQAPSELTEKPVLPLPPPRQIRLFKDVRIFSNTIRQAVDLMKKSGIEAVSKKTESDTFIEYHIRIPKPVDKQSKAC